MFAGSHQCPQGLCQCHGPHRILGTSDKHLQLPDPPWAPLWQSKGGWKCWAVSVPGLALSPQRLGTGEDAVGFLLRGGKAAPKASLPLSPRDKLCTRSTLCSGPHPCKGVYRETALKKRERMLPSGAKPSNAHHSQGKIQVPSGRGSTC